MNGAIPPLFVTCAETNLTFLLLYSVVDKIKVNTLSFTFTCHSKY